MKGGGEGEFFLDRSPALIASGPCAISLEHGRVVTTLARLCTARSIERNPPLCIAYRGFNVKNDKTTAAYLFLGKENLFRATQ